jgi:hypothetical protein
MDTSTQDSSHPIFLSRGTLYVLENGGGVMSVSGICEESMEVGTKIEKRGKKTEKGERQREN